MKTMLWIALSTCVHHDFPPSLSLSLSFSATMELPVPATQVCTKGAVIMSLTSFEETRSFLFRFLFSCVSFISCVCECWHCVLFFSSSPFAHGKTPNWFRETRCVWMSARTRKGKKKKKKSTVITAIVSALQLWVIFFFPSLSWHRNQV